MTAAATRATFSDFRIVKGRKVAQLVFELPIEAADEALHALGGLPQPATERWFGIARLTEEAVRKPKKEPTGDAVDASNREYNAQLARERYQQASAGEQAVTRAALLAEDLDFQRWLGVSTESAAAFSIRGHCNIASRAELATNAEALRRFLDLEARFKSERQFGPHAGRG